MNIDIYLSAMRQLMAIDQKIIKDFKDTFSKIERSIDDRFYNDISRAFNYSEKVRIDNIKLIQDTKARGNPTAYDLEKLILLIINNDLTIVSELNDTALAIANKGNSEATTLVMDLKKRCDGYAKEFTDILDSIKK